MCPAFAEIGAREGPFDLALVLIRCVSPLRPHASRLCADAMALCTHLRGRARAEGARDALGVRPASFPSACVGAELRLQGLGPRDGGPAATAQGGVPEGDFDVCGLGETRFF